MDTKTLYIGFVREEGILIVAFVTESFESAKKLAARHVDEALPNNVVVVFKTSLDTRRDSAVITAMWTPEGEEVIVHTVMYKDNPEEQKKKLT